MKIRAKTEPSPEEKTAIFGTFSLRGTKAWNIFAETLKNFRFLIKNFLFATCDDCTKPSFSGVSDCKMKGKTSSLAGPLKVEIWISTENVLSLYYRRGEPLGFPLFLA
ncbi:MAG: hypothetical protein II200_02920 [Bacteroidaceae bacterium]|nr:hypothetical protein [Bacteroidaceae bacterium]